MDEDSFIEEIVSLISLKKERSYFDIKREWYGNKDQDLLHDIICMANNLENKDAYIIIGVDEENDFNYIDVSTDKNRKNTQNIVDFLKDKKFAGGIRPTVYVKTIKIGSREIDIIVIKNDYYTPYFLTEGYKGVNPNNIYTRIQETNTPTNRSADICHIEQLWKKRFRLNETPLERVTYYLEFPKDWVYSEDETFLKYYKFAPEFKIEKIEVDRNRNAFYVFAQTNKDPYWYDINIYYHQTKLVSLGAVGLDGVNFFTPTALQEYIRFEKTPDYENFDITYSYFIRDSLEYIVHQYYLNSGEYFDEFAYMHFLECILIFNSESEKQGFEDYVRQNVNKFSDYSKDVQVPLFSELKGYIRDSTKKEYRDAIAINKMLKDFRKI
ncbi:MAG: ATP-binding protein [Bacillota bacterium]|nr:ATP-binding protein [Bacillota bacterium]